MRLDIKGQKFGRLLVLEQDKKIVKSTKDRSIYWICLCDCGNKTITRTYALTSGAAKSCGCLVKEKVSETHSKAFGVSNINALIKNYKQASKRKKLSFSLSLSEFSELIFLPCHYCGQRFSLRNVQKNISGDRVIEHNGIDRVDNSKGYELSNCVTCCTFCNYAKRNKTYEEFVVWINSLASFKINQRNIMNENYLFDTDSYKASHYLQYPPKTSSMFSYIESRGSDEGYEKTVFFGLQYFLKAYLTYRVTPEDVEEAKDFYALHGEPFNYDGWMYIAKELKGKLPVRIRAVPEGTIVPTHNILVSIESTDPKVFWVVSWLETMMLRYVWYGTSVATRSRKIKQIILDYLKMSSDDPMTEISFKLHDFGSRGVSSQESAMLGGAAHLVNFQGSDTVAGIRCANKYYGIKMAGFSIPAAEHSSITGWGKENEVEAYRNMLKQFAKPGALVAVVSDSYDLYNACEHLWGEQLKQEVIDSGATVVIRPDSGHPSTVVLNTLEILDSKFGSVKNNKGFKVLNNVRVIQGDGISEASIKEILNVALMNGYSATNIAFGMGGQLLQVLNRDTLKFAMKCSSITVDGEQRHVFKDPVTDHGKSSKAGRLDLIRDVSGNYSTVALGDADFAKSSVMQLVYENGDVLTNDTLDNIRARAKGELV